MMLNYKKIVLGLLLGVLHPAIMLLQMGLLLLLEPPQIKLKEDIFLGVFLVSLVEMSYLQGHDAINLMVERWGPHRLVFGTGLPVWDPGLPITGLTYAGLSTEALAAVAGGTLQNLVEGCAI